VNEPRPPFAAYVGAKHQPRILFVGEAWGAEEEHLESPFVGSSGQFLYQLLGETMGEKSEEYAAGLRQIGGIGFRRKRDTWAESANVAFTNVLALRPHANSLDSISVLKGDLPSDYPLAKFPITRNGANRFLAPEYLGELERLRIEIETSRPNLIVALGATALWSLTGLPNIGATRGVTAVGTRLVGLGRKFLPTYHPQACIYNFALRPIAKADLLKAWSESRTSVLQRPERRITISPTLEDIRQWLKRLSIASPPLLSCDIETKSGQITCIGFATSRSEALVVPLWAFGESSPHYWPTLEDELEAWRLISEILQTPIPKLFQNGMYDLQYLVRFGLRPRAVLHDTMLMHHSMFPELQKGLGFLASIYTSEASWKLMRTSKADVEKADD
jgi:uracil-DNA glycosylase